MLLGRQLQAHFDGGACKAGQARRSSTSTTKARSSMRAGFILGDAAAAQVGERHRVELADRRAVRALDVVGVDLQIRLGVDLGLLRLSSRLASRCSESVFWAPGWTTTRPLKMALARSSRTAAGDDPAGALRRVVDGPARGGRHVHAGPAAYEAARWVSALGTSLPAITSDRRRVAPRPRPRSTADTSSRASRDSRASSRVTRVAPAPSSGAGAGAAGRQEPSSHVDDVGREPRAAAAAKCEQHGQPRRWPGRARCDGADGSSHGCSPVAVWISTCSGRPAWVSPGTSCMDEAAGRERRVQRLDAVLAGDPADGRRARIEARRGAMARVEAAVLVDQPVGAVDRQRGRSSSAGSASSKWARR